MAGRGEPGIDALEGGGCGRHIADLAALAVHPQMEDALARLQIADPQRRELGAAQPVIEQSGEDGAVAQPLQRVGRRRVEQGAGLGVAERRRRALAGRRPAAAARRAPGCRRRRSVRRDSHRARPAPRACGARWRRRARAGFQRAAPGDDMGPGDLPQFGDGADADEAAELADIALIGAARVLVADVGGPFDFRGDVGETLELRGGEPPALALAAVPLGARLGARLGDCQLPVHGGSRCFCLFVDDNVFYHT